MSATVAIWRAERAEWARIVEARLVDPDLSHAEHEARVDAAAIEARAFGAPVRVVTVTAQEMLLALAECGEPNTPQGRAAAAALLAQRRWPMPFRPPEPRQVWLMHTPELGTEVYKHSTDARTDGEVLHRVIRWKRCGGGWNGFRAGESEPSVRIVGARYHVRRPKTRPT